MYNKLLVLYGMHGIPGSCPGVHYLYNCVCLGNLVILYLKELKLLTYLIHLLSEFSTSQNQSAFILLTEFIELSLRFWMTE